MESDLPTREEFEHLRKLTEDNNRLLLNMRKWGRIAFWFKAAIWTVVLVAPIFLIPYIVPYIPALSNIPGISGTSSSTSLFGIPSPAAVQAFLHPAK
jgi:hypothetical protein